jgi:hypothetical protein
LGAVAATIAAAFLLGWIVTLVADPTGEGANGAGLTYRGEFYLEYSPRSDLAV